MDLKISGKSGTKRKRAEEVAEQCDSINKYCGFDPDASFEVFTELPTVSGKEMFQRFISTRTPVKFNSFLPTFDASSWEIENLRKLAGEEIIECEKREGGKYGMGKKIEMKFSEFLDALQSGRDDLYMTTQKIEEDDSGPKYLFGPPTTKFTSIFPHEPSLLGNLLPYQFNIWFGSSKDQSSSGLHHDFHDNLYLLVKGKKRFKLYPPSAALQMKTSGKPVHIFPNGLISYIEGFREDGAHIIDVENWETENDVDVYEGEKFDANEENFDAEDDMLDQALDAMLAGSVDDFEDDYDDDLDTVGDAPPRKKRKLNEDEDSSLIPNNFVLKPASRKPIVVDLNAGEMLYLPCGWFHEVISESGGDKYHLAFNYWLHPPSTKDFLHPYTDQYWKEHVKRLKQNCFKSNFS